MRVITYTSTVCSTAIKSDCGLYRFALKRVWDDNRPIGAFLCANPSKADHLLNDATVFKCGNLAVNWEWGGFFVLNLFPNYSTDPDAVVRSQAADIVNLDHVQRILLEASLVVIACGNGHGQRLEELLSGVPKSKLYCLRRNKGGGFLHPSRITPEDYARPVPACATQA